MLPSISSVTNNTKRLYRFLLAIVSFAVFLIIADGLLSVYQFIVKRYILPPHNIQGIPLHVVCNGPPFYRLNPENPHVKSLGIYDPVLLLPRTNNNCRILFLGDSVIYDKYKDDKSRTFPKLSEKSINGRSNIVEVINAGVKGYSTYNELYSYKIFGGDMNPDVVVLCFCMNDVANPRLHWNYTSTVISNIPPKAIPNKAYDQEIITKYFKGRDSASAIVRSITTRWYNNNLKRKATKVIDGKAWPVSIAAGDWTSIETLNDYATPEWKWLDKTFTELMNVLEKDNARLAVIIMPLSYQLDKEYPIKPQRLFLDYFSKKNIPCLDLLPYLQNYDKAVIFQGKEDFWHPSKFGHQIIADIVSKFLKDNKLIEYRKYPSSSSLK